jgi:NADH-quinone oxidoreductase subunit C
MSNDLIFSLLEKHFPDAILGKSESHGVMSVETTREKIVEVLTFLRDNQHTDFNFLTTLCAVHFPKSAGRELSIVYHLHSFRNNVRLRVKIFFPIADPHCPSMTAVFPTANWMERQEYDFFGVIFDGHPDLRRILNVDEMEVFPMRKEYRLEDGTRTDKDDRFFGRDGHSGRTFD